jgi:hypothetical protein
VLLLPLPWCLIGYLVEPRLLHGWQLLLLLLLLLWRKPRHTSLLQLLLWLLRQPWRR